MCHSVVEYHTLISIYPCPHDAVNESWYNLRSYRSIGIVSVSGMGYIKIENETIFNRCGIFLPNLFPKYLSESEKTYAKDLDLVNHWIWLHLEIS